MRFDVKMPEELAHEEEQREAEYKRKYALWPKGVYDFEVLTASEGISKSSGNPMITIDCTVHHPDGYARGLKDYLVASLQGKIHALCTAVGLEQQYLRGDLNADDLVGRGGKLKLGVENDTYNGETRQKNKISGYVAREHQPTQRGVLAQSAHNRAKANAYAPADVSDLNDEIPWS